MPKTDNKWKVVRLPAALLQRVDLIATRLNIFQYEYVQEAIKEKLKRDGMEAKKHGR